MSNQNPVLDFQVPGSVSFVVGTQYDNFPQFGFGTIVGGKPPPPTAPISVSGNDDAYCPSICINLFCTPGSYGSSAHSLIEDLSFSTEGYSLSDIVSSPPKKNGGEKIKVKARKATTPEEARPRQPRTVYTIVELIVVANCWVDMTEYPITANNQDAGGFWVLKQDLIKTRRIRQEISASIGSGL